MKLFANALAAVTGLIAVVAVSGASAQTNSAQSIEDIPFWNAMSGLWEGVNTYFDDKMDYNIRSYSSLVMVELDGDKYIETEHRFYSEGLGTERYSGDLGRPGEGVEFVTKTVSKLIDATGTVESITVNDAPVPPGRVQQIEVLGDMDARRVTMDPETDMQYYRYRISFTSPNSRIRTNLGLSPNADTNTNAVRAFILYKDQRVAPESFEERRAALRDLHNVQVISSLDPDNPGQLAIARLSE